MSHSPIEGTHDHDITRAQSVSQSTTTDNVLVQPQYINEGRGERRDITVTNKTSKQRPRDHEASPVMQRWDSPTLIDDKHDPAPCRTHHGRDLDTCIRQSVNQEQGNVLIQPHASNEGRGEWRDITRQHKTSKQDHLTVRQVP